MARKQGAPCYIAGIETAIKNTEALMRRMAGEDLCKHLGPAGKILLERAKELAPYDEMRDYRISKKWITGKYAHIRDSFFIDTRIHGVGQTDILVGVNHLKAPHAHLMEYGWEKKPEGHPFMRPAVTQTQAAVRRAVKEAIDTAMMGEFRGTMWE